MNPKNVSTVSVIVLVVLGLCNAAVVKPFKADHPDENKMITRIKRAKAAKDRPTWSPSIYNVFHKCEGDYERYYCFNGGTCVHEYFEGAYDTHTCTCPGDTFGHRCEYLESLARFYRPVKMPPYGAAELSPLLTVLIIAIAVVVVAIVVAMLYFRRRT
ncbi:unnamed protein product [Soboliphyme baturini]|uniref:EGF-like domain-containing protein n=1 Tax=Soboliphyme baturini TaxID=241478 RepID=A0A183IPF6_9BILA|nr:unnamed protein product [Soboliphyme baturini]